MSKRSAKEQAAVVKGLETAALYLWKLKELHAADCLKDCIRREKSKLTPARSKRKKDGS